MDTPRHMVSIYMLVLTVYCLVVNNFPVRITQNYNTPSLYLNATTVLFLIVTVLDLLGFGLHHENRKNYQAFSLFTIANTILFLIVTANLFRSHFLRPGILLNIW